MKRTVLQHASSTWLVAHYMYPVLLFVSAMIEEGCPTAAMAWVVADVLVIIGSLPAILVFAGMLHLILRIPLLPVFKLMIWAVMATVIVGFYAWLCNVERGPYRSDLNFAFEIPVFEVMGKPAMIAIFFSIIIRSQKFFALDDAYTTDRNNSINNTHHQNQIL